VMEIFLSKPTPREQRECSFGKVALHTSGRKPNLLRPEIASSCARPSNSRPAKGRQDRTRATTLEENCKSKTWKNLDRNNSARPAIEGAGRLVTRKKSAPSLLYSSGERNVLVSAGSLVEEQ